MIEISPDKDPYTTRQLLDACLEKSNLRANLQSGETADRMQATCEQALQPWRANKRRENALASSEAARLYATPQNEERSLPEGFAKNNYERSAARYTRTSINPLSSCPFSTKRWKEIN